MRLYDLATTIRSKNAGPFRLTIDLVLEDVDAFERVLRSEEMQAGRIAALYAVSADDVHVIPFERILTIKIAMPRPGASSGAPADRDVYGCAQHFPLAEIDV
ncbi:MAG: DUF4387 family protein [Armatimonadota bacterium]